MLQEMFLAKSIIFIILTFCFFGCATSKYENLQPSEKSAEELVLEQHIELARKTSLKKLKIRNVELSASPQVLKTVNPSSVVIYGVTPNNKKFFAIVEIELPFTKPGLKLHPKDIYLILANGEKVTGFLDVNRWWVGGDAVTEDNCVTYLSSRSGSVDVRWLFLINRNEIASVALAYGGEENIPLKPYIKDGLKDEKKY